MKLVKAQCISPSKIELVTANNLPNVIDTHGYVVEDAILVVHLPNQSTERNNNEAESHTSVPGKNK